MLWGFIPCGLTYSILATALVTGSGARGAGLMLAFGLGTLPNLLLAGMLFKRFRDITRTPGCAWPPGSSCSASACSGCTTPPRSVATCGAAWCA